jgi:hypothetical protein
MSTYREQFDSAMKCRDKAEATAWLEAEVARYVAEYKQESKQARSVILANLGYMAGYYDSATAKKVHELFGATHPIFGSSDYFETVSPEQMGQDAVTKP